MIVSTFGISIHLVVINNKTACPYIYQREGIPPDPRGAQAKPNGLIYSFFRPSDDLQTYPYLIPSQFFAYHTLKLLFELVHNFNWTH
ncbi:unnamed protein product, partial [Adineta steineri]